MKVLYDKQVDALYIQFSQVTDGSAITKDISDYVSINYDIEGKVAGIEILNASKYLVENFLPEYKIDYTKTKKNPYYRKNRTFVEIDEDIANIFQSPENINNILRAIANSFPKYASSGL